MNLEDVAEQTGIAKVVAEASDETGFKWFAPGPVDGSVALGGERRVIRRSGSHLARIQQEARKIVGSALNASN
jgi:phosphoglucomutase